MLRVRLASPLVDADPVATAPLAPGQFVSERVAFTGGYGEYDPVTFPPLIVMLFKPAEPVTTNGGSCFQMVGLLPGGVLQRIWNLELTPTGAGSAAPLKMVAQLFALPGMLNLSFPEIDPRATVPAVVTHGLAELPRVAFITNFSLLAVPPLMRGGTNLIVPVQTPLAGLHVTVPGWFTGFEIADAAPDSNAMKRNDGSASAERMRTIFRAIRAPVHISLLEGSREDRGAVCPSDAQLTSDNQDELSARRYW